MLCIIQVVILSHLWISSFCCPYLTTMASLFKAVKFAWLASGPWIGDMGASWDRFYSTCDLFYFPNPVNRLWVTGLKEVLKYVSDQSKTC